ncbi:cyclic nucleotide-binding domain-containing protein [uncultured Shewanella sp.]|uniref:cyclic nucleotide-binding domain-containing protein n=1 Tax=uncultured Shewanella sp. TaxID=173975 RepID=UPI00261912F7|nr:cyclic nucleotide-binding domain-containing protein [uncultured Shewanella sp.]
MLKSIIRFFSYKVEKIQNMEQLDECEALINKSFGRVMRFDIESIEKEKASSNICHFSCRNKNGQVVGVVKLVEAKYLLKSKKLMVEYRINELPREILPNIFIVVGFCVDPSEAKYLIVTKLIMAVYQFMIMNGKVMAVALIKPMLYWYALKRGFRPFSYLNVKKENNGHRVPMALFTYNPNYIFFKLVLFFSRLKKTKKLSVNLISLVKKIESNECSDLFKKINHKDLPSEKLKDTLFHGVSEKSVNNFFSNSVVVNYQKGDLIIKKGEKYERCSYFVLNGFVLVSENGQVKEIIMEGHFFGKTFFLRKNPIDADLIAGCDNVKIGIVSLNALNNITNKDDLIRIWRNTSMSLPLNIRSNKYCSQGEQSNG